MEITANNLLSITCEICKKSEIETKIVDWCGLKFCRVNCFASVANQLVEVKIKNPNLKCIGEFFVKDALEHIKYNSSMDDFNKSYSFQKNLDKLIFNLVKGSNK